MQQVLWGDVCDFQTDKAEPGRSYKKGAQEDSGRLNEPGERS